MVEFVFEFYCCAVVITVIPFVASAKHPYLFLPNAAPPFFFPAAEVFPFPFGSSFFFDDVEVPLT